VKLLFDQNLSFRLCRLLADIFPDSSQVRLVGLAEAEDTVIWKNAGGERVRDGFSGFGFCGDGRALWASTEGDLAEMRKSTDGKNRVSPAKPSGGYHCI